MSSRRMSLGGGNVRAPLGDANMNYNLGSSSHRPASGRSETPLKDRLALLEEWRQSRSGSSSNTTTNSNATMNDFYASMESATKRPRWNDTDTGSVASFRSSGGGGGHNNNNSAFPPPTEGTTALERFRLRKQQQILMNQPSHDESVSASSGPLYHHQHHPDSAMGLDDSFDMTTWSSSTSVRSSSRRGGLEGGARRMTLMPLSNGRRTSIVNAPGARHSGGTSRTAAGSAASSSSSTQADRSTTTAAHSNGGGGGRHQGTTVNVVVETGSRSQTQTTLSQLTVEEPVDDADEPGMGVVEGAGLRSQIRDMNQRIEQLEKEKLELSIANAPLQARFRQKEDAWLKEQSRLVLEIESLKAAACEENERFRDLQVQYETAEAEVKHLRLEVRKASSSANTNNLPPMLGSGTTWTRQLQNDRELAELKEKLNATLFDLETSRLEKVSVEKELHATKLELESIARTFEELQQEYDHISKSTSDKRDAEIQLEVLTTEHIATSAQLNAVCSDLASTKARAEATLEAKDEEHKKIIEQLQFDLSVLKSRASKMEQRSSKTCPDEEDDAVLKARIEERDRRIADLEAELLRGEELRRQMHNRIQELRGNVRVYVRTRPFLPNDKQHNDPAIDVSPDGESLSILDARSNSRHAFKFDKVFPPSSGQDQVFQEVADFVQSALDGYQVCLFSYGQTGSGKTHTMQGSGNGAMRGIIPRAVEQILMQAKVMRKQRWDFKLSASFLEIYNEDLKDLLTVMSSDKSSAKNPPKLAIKRDLSGKSFVEGLTEVPIETINSEEGMLQLEALMSVAARARSVASTNMNAQSSRSHSVFKLHIRGFNDDSQAEVEGSLSLCDLAGSERLDRSGASNDAKRLKETQAINKSLSSLGDVFTSLSQGASHIPYRNSKLTYLLQDCLSGDGKALMFVNLSPTTASSSESLCSLRFAQRVNAVELGKPTKNIQYKR